MSIHIPGSAGAQSVQVGSDVLQAAVTAAQAQFGDDPALAEALIKLAFDWLYYLKKGDVVSVDTLLRDYGVLREAAPKDITGLQEQLAKFNV